MSVFAIKDGRDAFWQWDTGCKMTLSVPTCENVHFYNGTGEDALTCPVYEKDGERIADVPDVLLQIAGPLRVYAYVTDEAGRRTVVSEVFLVRARPKPQEYIYTEEESWSVEKAVADALQEAKESGAFRGEPGPKGDPGVVKFVVVTALPKEDGENAIYLLPAEGGEEENLFDEYIFVEGKWEKIGSAAVAVNLDEYVKKTDAAVEGGGLGLVKLQSNPYYTGVTINPNGMLALSSADPDAIAKKSNYRLPITPSVLDYAVKVGVTTNTEPLTAEEKKAACSWLGAGIISANDDGTLSILLADGSRYTVNATKEEA